MGVADEIKERLDIVEVVGRYVPLKKAGRNYKGLCPFHAEKTPSFVVFPDTGTWHCFGACSTGGDIFSFIMKRENLDFSEALRVLAPMAGVSLDRQDGPSSAEQERQKRLLEVMAAAANYYQRQLHNDGGRRALQYVTGRQLSEETAEMFQLGYAPDSWDALQVHLRAQGHSLADLEAAGLIIARPGGSHYDRFRDRLMIPIRDQRGRPIAFGARLLPGGRVDKERPQPKYLNSPQTSLFDKGRQLFGLYEARRDIRAADEAILVEGYMDVMAAHQHGIKNVVATMGTALTEPQLRRLKRYTSRFVLALDADTAGQAATLRGVQQAREALDRVWVAVPTAGGLIRFEGRLNAQLRIMTLPAGQDPDEVIRADPELWARLVRDAEPVVEYFMRLVTTELDLATARGKSEAVERLIPLIREIADDVERTHYVQSLARMVQVDEQIIHGQILRARRPRSERPPARSSSAARRPAIRSDRSRPEPQTHCLAQLLRRPELLPALDTKCTALQMAALEADDFAGAMDQQIFSALLASWSSEEIWDEDGLRAQLDAPFQDRLEELLRYGQSLPVLPVTQSVEDLVNVVIRLRIDRRRLRLAELQSLLEQAQEEGDGQSVSSYTELVVAHTAEMGSLQRLLNSRTWTGRRKGIQNGLTI